MKNKSILLNRCCFLMALVMFYVFEQKNVVAQEHSASQRQESVAPLPTDTRIKTFVYSPNEIFQVKFKVGYQSIIELQENEDVELITFGDRGSWEPTVLGRRIFLKVSDTGAKTNMTIITDKRTYLLEISSNDDDDDNDAKITYILRFFYPDIVVDIPPTTAKLAKIALNKQVAAVSRTNKTVAEGAVANVGSVNTNYTYAGNGTSILPTMVFDNGKRTYFKFTNTENVPIISAVSNDYEEIPLRVKQSGEYVYVDTVERQITLRQNKELVCIFNEAQQKSVAYINAK